MPARGVRMNSICIADGTIIVGGLPQPIGGVTTFLRRLLMINLGKVVAFVDLYPSADKKVPDSFKGIYYSASSKLAAWLNLFLALSKFRSNCVFFFNFSRLRSLFVFAMLPKFQGVKWELMLHHGELSTRLPFWFVARILRRFDKVYAIGLNQQTTYVSYGLKSVCMASSYVPPVIEYNRVSLSVKGAVDVVKNAGKRLVMASGFPRGLYRHDVAMRLCEGRDDRVLMLFLYGDGELKAFFQELNRPNILVFWDTPENDFNYALSCASLYVRPTLKDSFGIACADAVSFGVPVVASDVCVRASGVTLFNYNDEFDFMEKASLALSGS